MAVTVTVLDDDEYWLGRRIGSVMAALAEAEDSCARIEESHPGIGLVDALAPLLAEAVERAMAVERAELARIRKRKSE